MKNLLYLLILVSFNCYSQIGINPIGGIINQPSEIISEPVNLIPNGIDLVDDNSDGLPNGFNTSGTTNVITHTIADGTADGFTGLRWRAEGTETGTGKHLFLNTNNDCIEVGKSYILYFEYRSSVPVQVVSIGSDVFSPANETFSTNTGSAISEDFAFTYVSGTALDIRFLRFNTAIGDYIELGNIRLYEQ